MGTLWNDARFAFRMLLKTPGVTAAAILMLALGTGANTALFSTIKGVLLSCQVSLSWAPLKSTPTSTG